MSFEDARLALSRRTAQPVYVVGIDQATRSGWAVHDTRRVVLHGATGNDAHEMVDALDRMRRLPDWDWKRVLVFFEDHRKLRREGAARFGADGKPIRHADDSEPIALGDARGGWRVLLDLRAHPKAQRALVEPKEWRRVLSGLKFGQGDDWKSAAIRWASFVTRSAIDDDNEAEACAIATWGACDGLYQWAKARLEFNARAAGKGLEP